tara:strand:- start:233 stop:406 length:174 start_codon:yes stop_codon:yes gene_type:complete
MRQSYVIKMLEEIQQNIFMRLDKGGTYRSIDEEAARGIVRSVIRSHIEKINDHYENE